MVRKLHHLQRGTGRASRRQFDARLRRIVDQCREREPKCGALEWQCRRKDGELAISREYVQRVMEPRTKDILWYEGQDKAMHGFLLATTKKSGVQSILYVDLVCSQHRLGKQLLKDAENLAIRRGASHVALRAAVRELIPVYRALGYYRAANDCHARTRSQTAELRRLDADAVELDRNGKEIVGSGDGWWMSKCVARPSKRRRARKQR